MHAQLMIVTAGTSPSEAKRCGIETGDQKCMHAAESKLHARAFSPSPFPPLQEFVALLLDF
jgi:hypothetical protein